MSLISCLAPCIAALALCSGSSAARNSRTPADQSVFADRTYFYAGGHYINSTGSATGQFMIAQIYVERLVPHFVKHKYPLVFNHGSAQTGTNWLNTPDDREGWASYFLRRGYIVYLTDQPQRGRSPWFPDSGELIVFDSGSASNYFTAPEKVSPLPYPQAALHTQWPGTGLAGDPVFDAFYASQVQYQSNSTLTAILNQNAYTALLDRIGSPVILITHSQSGPFGWQLGDSRPDLVKGILSIEPGVNPFETWTGAPYTPGYLYKYPRIPFGITDLPLHYDPPIGNDGSLLKRKRIPPPNKNLSPCILQFVGEASYHAVFSYCSAEYLKQAGVRVEFVNLRDVGIHGNGHFSFMELNNLQIAEEVVLPSLERIGCAD